MLKWLKQFFCCWFGTCRTPADDDRFYDDLIDDESQYH